MCLCLCVCVCVCVKEGETQSERHRQRARERETETERGIDPIERDGRAVGLTDLRTHSTIIHLQPIESKSLALREG